MRQRLSLIVFFSINAALASGIDAKFKFRRLKQKLAHSAANNSRGVSFYQEVLSQSLATSCDFFPSDSQRVQVDFKRCSSSYAILSAMERFIREPDAGMMGHDVIQIHNKNFFYDLPTDCSFSRL